VPTDEPLNDPISGKTTGDANQNPASDDGGSGTKGEAPKIKKPWTIMVYIAADNDLTNFGIESLKKMKIATSPYINIVAEFDSGAERATERYFFGCLPDSTPCQKDPYESISCNVVDSFKHRNAGDPKNLIHFVRWALKEYPACHYFLIIWGHSAGVDDSFPRVPDDAVQSQPEQDHFFIPRHRLLNVTNQPIANPPRSKSVAFVDHPTSYLTTKGLSDALRDSLHETEWKALLNNKPLDIIGFDACNMNLVEMGYELKEFTHYMVASQDEVPDGSWPYDRIFIKAWEKVKSQLAPFIKTDETRSLCDQEIPILDCEKLEHVLNVREFISAICTEYVRAYQDYVDQPVCLSALDLYCHESIRKSFNDLTAILTQASRNRQVHDAIIYARCRVRSFYTRVLETRELHTRDIYIDIIHFCKLLVKYLRGHKLQRDIAGYIKRIEHFIEEFTVEANGPIIVVNKTTANEDHCYGTSVYFPGNYEDQFGDFYQDLEFSRDTGWVEFVEDFLDDNPVVCIQPTRITHPPDIQRGVKGNPIDHSKGNPIDHSKGNPIDHSKGNPIDQSKIFQTVMGLPPFTATYSSEKVDLPCIQNVIYNFATIVQTCRNDDDDENAASGDLPDPYGSSSGR
jgi:Clostripain family